MTRIRNRIQRSLLASLTVVVGGALALALIETPQAGQGLTGIAADALPQSGVTNPVTAVLLNFRAFDTLLEIAVLLLTLIGAWALRLPRPRLERLPSSIIFDNLLRVSVPVLTIIAAYLLWIGAKAPGGAFQAGAVLAGVGVLLHFAGALRLTARAIRWLAVVGLLVFMGIGVALVLISGALLQYPLAQAGTLILVIETAATLSIAAILTALFVAVEPENRGAVT